MAQALLLVADDQEDNRIVFSTILRHYGYNVIEAPDGAEAVEQGRLHSPDLILVDLRMAGIDGWEATQQLRADPVTSGVPIIVISAEDHPLPKLGNAGFCAYVRKPILPKDLVKASNFAWHRKRKANHGLISNSWALPLCRSCSYSQ